MSLVMVGMLPVFSQYKSVWRCGIHVPLLGYSLEMVEIIDGEDNYQLTEYNSSKMKGLPFYIPRSRTPAVQG